MEIELLEYLSLKCGCMYLSDIRSVHKDAEKRTTLSYYLRRIAPDMCSLREWNDAVHYITNHDQQFEDEATAREYLLMYLYAEMKWS